MDHNTVKVKFNFFRLETRGKAINLHDILAEIQKRSLDERTVEINGIPRRLEADFKGTYAGHTAYLFTTVRTTRVPRKINSRGQRESLHFGVGDGLGEDVAIAIHSTGKIAAIQSTQYSMKPSAISKYINQIYPDINIDFLPIVKFNPLERISKAQEIKKFKVKLAGLLNLEKLKQCGLSAADALELQHFYIAPFIEIECSVGRKSGGLGEKFRSWIKSLKWYSDDDETNEITKLTAQIIEGEEDDAKSVFIDLLSDKLQGNIEISMNDNMEIEENELLIQSCHVLQEKYNEYSDYMETT